MANRYSSLLVVGHHAVGTDGNGNVVAFANLNPKERGRSHTQHGERVPVEGQLPPDDIGFAAEFALPEGVADHSPRIDASIGVVLWRNGAAHDGVDAKDIEEIAADVEPLGIADFAARCQVEPSRAPGHHAAERLLLPSDLVPLCVGEACAARRKPTGPRRPLLEIDVGQLLRVFDRQGPQPDGFDQFEDRGVGADTQG